MKFSPKDFVSPGALLAEVTQYVDDRSYKFLSKGFYQTLIQSALNELAFDTFFDQKQVSVPVPENLRVEIPSGCFNLRNIYAYNGNECNIQTAAKVYWKRNLWTGGTGFLANDRGANNGDPFYKNRSQGIIVHGEGGPNNQPPHFGSIKSTLYCNIQNGTLMLSSSCKSYKNLFMIFNGTGGDISEAPIIPLFLKEAVKLWAINEALIIRIAKSPANEAPKWNMLLQHNSVKLNGRRSEYDGAWYKAELRVKSMDTNERNDLKEYISRPDY